MSCCATRAAAAPPLPTRHDLLVFCSRSWRGPRPPPLKRRCLSECGARVNDARAVWGSRQHRRERRFVHIHAYTMSTVYHT